jgi:hypothetical protein
MRNGIALVVLCLTSCNYAAAPSPDLEPSPDASTPADDAPPPDVPAADDPTAGIEWVTWPEQQPNLGQPAWGAQLIDIGRHLPATYGDTYWADDGLTAGHETSHGIHAHLRNYEAPSSIGWNAFYVLGDRVAFVEEPAMRKADIKAHIPIGLRGDRYDLYLEGQVAWDDTPLYVFDEWNSYLNGAEVAVGQVQAGLYSDGWTDAVMGPLEFTVYAIATAKAAQQQDPDYFATKLQFRRFTAWNIARAMRLFSAGRAMTEFAWDKQDAYAQTLRTATEAEPLRAFARETWGAEWTQTVLGF